MAPKHHCHSVLASLLLISGLHALAQQPLRDAGIPEDSQPVSPAVVDGSRDIAGSTDSSQTTNSPLLNALESHDRFDIYLGQPEIPRATTDEYLKNEDRILTQLKACDKAGARNILNTLVQDPQLDFGLSEQLGQKIDAVQKVLDIETVIETSDESLQNSIAQPQQSEAEIAETVHEQIHARDQERPGDSEGSTPELTQTYLDALKIKDKIRSNEKAKETLLDQCKADFQLYIVQLYKTRHFHHVLIAAAFYRQLFEGSGLPAEMQKDEENATETIASISSAVKDAQKADEDGRVALAANKLQEAYSLGEFCPETSDVSMTEKARIKTYENLLHKLNNRLQMLQLSDAEAILHDIVLVAPDFDTATDKRTIDAAKSQSLDLLTEAKSDIAQGDLTNALEKIQQAEKHWSDNPDLSKGVLNLFQREVKKQQARITFDQLMMQDDYPSLSERRAEFFDMLQGDPKRKEQFEIALNKVNNADTSLAKAKTLESSGDTAGAWEAIQKGLLDWPGNSKLNRRRNDLAGEAPEFVLALNKAQDAEQKQEWGYCLSWYAIAQHLYPASFFAQQGITRISRIILHQPIVSAP
jgi:hypothetical protein